MKPSIVRAKELAVEAGPTRQSPAELDDFRQFSMCINCMLCYAACPVISNEPDFLGPAAIALGHRDIESVKRYTGFGTGWCQGKQCLSLCARKIAELGGEPPTVPITPRPPFHPVPLAHLARLARGEKERK